jgi:cation diffusion facilitator CzcD-associated flavoprotein CzcO
MAYLTLLYNQNVWLSTNLKSASFNEENKMWTLIVERAGEEATITAPHLVLAIGGGGSVAVMPQLPNRVCPFLSVAWRSC